MHKYSKHILLLSPFASPNIGGVESVLDKIIHEGKTHGCFFTLITYQPLTTQVVAPKYERLENYEIFRVSWFWNGVFNKVERYFPLSFLYLFPGLFFKSLIYFLANHRSVDCIHAHGLVCGLIAVLLKKLHPIRVVLNTHAIYQFANRKLLSFLVRKILEGIDVIIAVSEVSRQELIKLGLLEANIKSFINWVDTDVFKPISKFDPLVEKNLLNHNVLFVGRLIDKKGVSLLIETSKEFSDIGFHFVGSGPLESELRALSLSVPNVFFYGTLRQFVPLELNLLLSLYSSCDAFISPYLYDEGFSTTLVEALACGCPVAVPDRGSPPKFLSQDVAYFFPPAVTSEHIAQFLEKLQRNENVPLRKTCVEYANKQFGKTKASIIFNSYEK